MHDKLSKMQCKIKNPTCFKITWHDSREFHDTAAFTSRRHGLVRKPPTIYFSTNSTNLDRTTASELFKFSAVLDVKNSPTCSLLVMDHLNNLKFKLSAGCLTAGSRQQGPQSKVKSGRADN